MAVVYATTLKNTRLDAVTTAAGTTAELEIATTGFALILATIPLANPIGAGAAGGILTITMPQSDTSADDTGAAAEARITDGAATNIVTGLTVGLSAADIILDSLDITAGQTVTINSATITHG